MLRLITAMAVVLCATQIYPTETRTLAAKDYIYTVTSEHTRKDKTTTLYRRIYQVVEQTPGAKIAPGTFALAVTNTDHPRMLTAIAFHESRFDPAAQGKDGDSGMFQVVGKHWGEVSTVPAQQAKQAADVLSALKKKHKKIWLVRYNGAGEAARQYAGRVTRTYARV